MDNSIINSLRKLGLTTYQSKAYLTMVREGGLTAKEISEKAGIPYAKIHSTLLSLKYKGWIIVDEGRPKKYRAKPPREVIEELMKNEIEELKAEANMIIEELQPIYEGMGIEEKSEILILKGVNIIVERVVNALKNTRRSLDMAIPGGLMEFHEEILDALVNLKRDVKVRILMDEEAAGKINIPGSYGFEVNVNKRMFGGGLIVDDEETIILLGGKSRIPLAIWSNNRDLTKIAKIYFEYLWKSTS